jgi:hypothetical protein
VVKHGSGCYDHRLYLAAYEQAVRFSTRSHGSMGLIEGQCMNVTIELYQDEKHELVVRGEDPSDNPLPEKAEVELTRLSRVIEANKLIRQE